MSFLFGRNCYIEHDGRRSSFLHNSEPVSLLLTYTDDVMLLDYPRYFCLVTTESVLITTGSKKTAYYTEDNQVRQNIWCKAVNPQHNNHEKPEIFD